MIQNAAYLELMEAVNSGRHDGPKNGSYLLGPLVLKLCVDYGLSVYNDAYDVWVKSNLKNEKVYGSMYSIAKELEDDGSKLQFVWGGPAYRAAGGMHIIGLHATIKHLEYSVLMAEAERCKAEIVALDHEKGKRGEDIE